MITNEILSEVWEDAPECVEWEDCCQAYVLNDRRLLYRGATEVKTLYHWIIEAVNTLEYETDFTEVFEVQYVDMANNPYDTYCYITWIDSARAMVNALWLWSMDKREEC